MPLNTEVLKEPRGFLRCLELFFGIVAFSTLANYSTEFSFDIKCKNATLDDQKILEVQVGYPFNIASTKGIQDRFVLKAFRFILICVFQMR